MPQNAKDLQLRELKDTISELNRVIESLNKAVEESNAREKEALEKCSSLEEQLDVLSPVHYVTPAFPPAYVMTATGDFLIGQPDYLLPVLEANGIAHEFKIYGTQENKLPHVFHCNLRLAEAAQCNREEMDFFKTYC